MRCNAPEFSAVIGATGRVQPCFFIPGPPDSKVFGVGAGGDSDLREYIEQRRYDGAARGDSQRRTRRMQDLRLFDVAGARHVRECRMTARNGHPGSSLQPRGRRLKVVLYNPYAVLFTTPARLARHRFRARPGGV